MSDASEAPRGITDAKYYIYDGGENIIIVNDGKHTVLSREESERFRLSRENSALKCKLEESQKQLAELQNAPLNDPTSASAIVISNALITMIAGLNESNAGRKLVRELWQKLAPVFNDVGEARDNIDNRK
jgi:hypothetical protein